MPTTAATIANVTKQLVCDQPFNQISVTLIANQAGISRQAFYEHFHDKYDVLEWIYAQDIAHIVEFTNYDNWPATLDAVLDYFDAEHTFYRRVFKLHGQNSPKGFITDNFMTLVCRTFDDLLAKRKLVVDHEYCQFVREMIALSVSEEVQRWLADPHCRPVKQERQFLTTYLEDSIQGLLLRLQ